MRVCFDLDGTIAENKIGNETYEEVRLVDGAEEALNELSDNGVYIIIHTARNMGTCNNNLGKVIARQAAIVTKWLAKWNIPYDELLFGKPNVDYFVDDKAVEFNDNWKEITQFLMVAKEGIDEENNGS